MCLGLSLIFGVMRVINFAQGEFLMLGMYFAFYVVTGFGLVGSMGPLFGPVLAALLAGPAMFAFGWMLHLGLIRRVTGVKAVGAEAEGHYAQLILTLGVSLVLANGALILFGSMPQVVKTPLSSIAWNLGPLFGLDIYLFINQARTWASLIFDPADDRDADLHEPPRRRQVAAGRRRQSGSGELHGHRRGPGRPNRLRDRERRH